MEKDNKRPSLRFSGFSDAWEQNKLENLAGNTFGGGTPRTSDPSFWYGDIPWIQSSDIFEDDVQNATPRNYTSRYGISQSATKLVPANSIAVIVRVGVGKLAFIPYPYATSQDFVSLSNLKIDGQFGVYSLLNKMKMLANEVQGTSIKGITKNELLKKDICVPNSTLEQNKIGSFMKSIDSLISLYKRKYDKLVNIKRALLERMFPKKGEDVPELRFKGYTDPWEQRKLCEVSDRVIVGLATSVTEYYSEVGRPILRNLNIKDNFLDDSDLLYIDESFARSQKSKQVHSNDVITVHTGYIGISCLVPPKFDECLTFTTLITTPKQNVIDGSFLVHFLNSNQGKTATMTITTQGGRQNLNSGDFMNVMVPLPCIKEQVAISSVLNKLDDLITLHQKKLKKLKEIKKACLEKMFVQ